MEELKKAKINNNHWKMHLTFKCKYMCAQKKKKKKALEKV